MSTPAEKKHQSGFRIMLLGRVVITFLVVIVPFFLFLGYMTQKSLEAMIRSNTHEAIRTFINSEGNELDGYFENLETLGHTSSAYLEKRLALPPIGWQDFDDRYIMKDGAFRTNLDFGHKKEDVSGVFISSLATVTSDLKREVYLTGHEFTGYAKGVRAAVFNTYYISKRGFLRIYPKDWAMQIEADHDFTSDVFYYTADPEHNPDRSPEWTPAYYDAIWKHWMISLVTPVYVDDQFLGIVGHDVILDQIYDQILNKRYFHHGYVFLFDEEGHILLHPDHLDRLREVALMGDKLSFDNLSDTALQELIRNNLSTETTEKLQIHRYKNESGETYFAYIYDLDFQNWTYGIIIPEAEVMSVLPMFRVRFLIIAGITWCVLFAIFILTTWLTVVRPLRHISEVTRRIGEGNFDISVDHDSKDEIGLLAHSVNQMTANLKSTTEELRLANLELREEIAERRRAHEALQLSEKRFRKLFEESPDGVYVRIGNQFVVTNPSMAEIFGFEIEELTAPDFDIPSLVPESHQGAMRNQMESIENGTYPSSIESFCIHTKNGDLRHIEIKLTRIEWDNQKAVLGFVRDITQQKSLKAQLQHSQRMEAIGKLAGGIAHDFNNLLTAITGNAEIALFKLEEDHPARRYVREIDATSERAATLTRQLLAFSRKQVIQPRTINLNEALSNMRNMLKRVIGEDIGLQFIHSPDLWNVEADPSQIEQVVVNLAVNARDAMPNGGKLTIETINVELDEEYAINHLGVEPGSYVQLSVSDTGHGMDKEVIEHIFEPFFTTKGESKGTGLGLATVYGIVKQNHGIVHVYSEINIGSTFRIYLPKFSGQALNYDQQPDENIDPHGTETILVVEDEEGVRDMATRILEQYGYSVLSAPTPKEAIALYYNKHTEIDMILSDVIMPGMTGPQMIAQMQQEHPNILVLYMSGHTENAIVEHGVLKPGILFIPKPFRPIDLGIQIRNALDSDRAKQNDLTGYPDE